MMEYDMNDDGVVDANDLAASMVNAQPAHTVRPLRAPYPLVSPLLVRLIFGPGFFNAVH